MDFDTIRETINDNCDLADVANDLEIPSMTIGGSTSILCPFHPDHRFGNCRIKNNRGHCFACNTSFDIIGLVQQVKGVSYIDAVKYLDELYGLNLDLSQKKETAPPLIISAEVFQYAGITDISGFKKLFVQNRDMAFDYLTFMIHAARKRYSEIKSPIPEISTRLQYRINVLANASRSMQKWRSMKESSLRIFTKK